MKKKGVSPVIATVLLIAMVIVLALIMFLWFQGMGQETIEKFDKNIALVCEEVSMEASYTQGKLSVSNKGNVPIYKLNIIEYSDGSYNTKDIEEYNIGWPSRGLTSGSVFSESYTFSGINKIELIPVLVGDSKGTKKRHLCEQNSYEIVL